MLARWLSLFSFICFGVLTLLALYVARKPLCIDSKVVERIDRIGISSTDTVYRCMAHKSVAFSSYFNEQSRWISQRVIAMERFLDNLAPFQRKVQVVIIEDRPYLFRVQDHQVYIGQKLFEQEGHLEKALAKVWYRSRTDSFFAHQQLLEEVLTDLLVSMATGRLKVMDPLSQQQTVLGQWRWPYLIKSAQGYCDSPWKFSEHIKPCAEHVGQDIEAFQNKSAEYSVRSLLSAAWIRSFQRLSLFEQNMFMKQFAFLLAEDHTPDLPILKKNILPAESPAVAVATEAVKNINSYFLTSELMNKVEVFPLFAAYLQQELAALGFKEENSIQLDLLYISQRPVDESEKNFKVFLDLASAHPGSQIAIMDNEKLWLLPSKHPLPLHKAQEIRSHRAVVEKCGAFDFKYALEYSAWTEKLLVVDSCKVDKKFQYARYLSEGVSGFGQQNLDSAFIQFHLPSLRMKLKDLQEAESVYDIVSQRQASSPTVQALGWQSVYWDQAVHAFQPKASIDAIEWFRAPSDIPRKN